MATRTPRMAADIMTRDVITLDENARLDHLEQAMRALRFRHMPVVEGGTLVGVVSHRDLLRASASALLPSQPQRAENEFVNEHFRVRDVMTRGVFTVSPATPVTEVAEQMMTRKLGCVPVCEEGNHLVGIITEADFVKLSLRLLEN